MKGLVTLLGKAEGLLRKTKEHLLTQTDKQFVEVKKWHRDDPHNMKRSDFDFLLSASIVFDLGGYEGQWSSDIYARYNCNVYVFEPVAAFADMIQKRFQKNPSIKVFAIGLAEADRQATIKTDLFSSRIIEKYSISPSADYETIQLRSFNEFITEFSIQHIDLIKINIEGAEFPLLENLIASGTIKHIKCLLIQFHNFADDAIKRRKYIQAELSKTHTCQFDYPFVWECWKMRE